MGNLQGELFRMRVEFDLIQKVSCSKQEEKQIKQLLKNGQPLPEELHTDNDGTHYKFKYTDMSKEDMEELLLYRKLKYLKTIKNCMIFLVILIIMPIVLVFIQLNIQ
jgi:hypothetical protein